MKSRVVVIVGGDAAGMSAASKAKRTQPDTNVIVLERGEYVSYAACGLPYFLEGVVSSVDDLISRTPDEHRANGIDLRCRHEAVALDTRGHVVRVKSPEGEYDLRYDKLLIATGASPKQPPFARVDFDGVFTLRNIPNALAINEYLDRVKPRRAALIGGGYIGMEMAEALTTRGIDTTLAERGSRVLKRQLDEEMAQLVAEHLAARGVRLLFEKETTALSGGANVEGVRFADGESLPAELVIVGVGASPNAQLAENAGIKLGESGAIEVDAAMRTSAFHVYAAGDCATVRHVVTDRNVYIPLGSTANKQGRIAGENLVGGHATFNGVVGTMVCKVFDRAFARTGLIDEQSRDHGFRPKSAMIEAHVRSGYYDPPTIHVKLTYDERSRRLLGGQLFGDESVAKRIDVVATALHNRMTVDDFAQLDLSYAPPFAPVWDPLLVAANVAAR
ncbi:MAG: FAD-dependent oxidoreductase [Candidatus Poribacteria bacterium]|nr:FAD-dependent oxidoreductase [Candidatus Poribacteria bacterium]